MSDLYDCALNRAAFGIVEDNLEQILRVYFSGDWPVRWSDCYPQGQLMAIYPHLPPMSERDPPEITYEEYLQKVRDELDWMELE